MTRRTLHHAVGRLPPRARDRGHRRPVRRHVDARKSAPQTRVCKGQAHANDRDGQMSLDQLMAFTLTWRTGSFVRRWPCRVLRLGVRVGSPCHVLGSEFGRQAFPFFFPIKPSSSASSSVTPKSVGISSVSSMTPNPKRPASCCIIQSQHAARGAVRIAGPRHAKPSSVCPIRGRADQRAELVVTQPVEALLRKQFHRKRKLFAHHQKARVGTAPAAATS